MATGTIGWGAKFGIEGTTPGSYVDLADVKSITPPGMTREAPEVTDLLSANRWQEYTAGLMTLGEAEITLNYQQSAADALYTALGAGVDKFQVTFPSGMKMQFSGVCTGFSPPTTEPGGVMESTATFQGSGKPTWVAAA